MLRTWSYPKRKDELFLKLAVPKKQAKSLKTICEELHFYCICRLHGWNFIKKQVFKVKFYNKQNSKIIYTAQRMKFSIRYFLTIVTKPAEKSSTRLQFHVLETIRSIERLIRMQWRLISTNVIRCFRPQLWVGYFIHFKFTRVSSLVYQSLYL